MGKVTGEQILFGILAYIWILFLVPLLAKKDDPFLHDHAKQGMVLFIAWVCIYVVGSIIPFLGWFIILPLGNLLLLVLWVWAIISVATGKQWTFPFFGEKARAWKF